MMAKQMLLLRLLKNIIFIQNNSFNPDQRSVVFRGVISDLIWAANKMTGFILISTLGLNDWSFELYFQVPIRSFA